jgi:hypothetical protein
MFILGLWHIVSWAQIENPNKDSFKLAVGGFTAVIGVIGFFVSSKMFPSDKDN